MISHKQLYQSVNLPRSIAYLSDATNLDVDIFVDNTFVALQQRVDVE